MDRVDQAAKARAPKKPVFKEFGITKRAEAKKSDWIK